LLLVRRCLVGIARCHEELGGPKVSRGLLLAALRRCPLRQRQELALPVRQVADPRGHRADLLELAAAQCRQPVELKVEAHIRV
jgi:hypothetical protein